MKTEFLQEIGLSEEQISKIMAENGKDIAREQKRLESEQQKLSSVTVERDTLKSQLDDVQSQLRSFDGVDKTKYEAELQRLNNTLETKAKEYEQAIKDRDSQDARRIRQAETRDFVKGYSQKFLNDILEQHYIVKLDELLESESSKGKSRQDLFESLIKDDKGNYLANTFAPSDKQPKLDIPPVADLPPKEVREAKPRIF